MMSYNFAYKTQEQALFIETMGKMKFRNEEEIINNISYIYSGRVNIN